MRHIWKFAYTADKLLEAAQAKHSFHTGRLTWWTAKRDEIKETIKSDGIEIDESVADQAGKSGGYPGYSTLGRPSQVSIRTDLVQDLNECLSKVQEHRGKVREYDAWIQVLESQGKASLDLDQDDWLFFFGK
jgi:hypothetical protein